MRVLGTAFQHPFLDYVLLATSLIALFLVMWVPALVTFNVLRNSSHSLRYASASLAVILIGFMISYLFITFFFQTASMPIGIAKTE